MSNFTPEHCLLYLREHLAPKYTPNDEWLTLFTDACNRTGLDPAQRQILGQVHNVKVKRNGIEDYVPKFSTLVTIDGLRVIAERSGKYEGQCGPYYCGSDGEWRDVWTERKPPTASKVGIFRKGAREPIWGIALFEEFKQSGRMWTGMPCHMIAKCAEAVGHRKAFPEAVAGLYIEDEMPPDGNLIPEGVVDSSGNPPAVETKQLQQRNAVTQQESAPNALQEQKEQPNERAIAFSKLVVEGVKPDTLQASIDRVKTKLVNFPQLMSKTIEDLEKAVA